MSTLSSNISGSGIPPSAVEEIVEARIEARVRPLEESLARFADTTGKAIQGLSDRISNEIKETHAIIRLSSTEAKSEAIKVGEQLAAMNKDKGKVNYTAVGVLVSVIGLVVAGGQVVGHWLMESRIAPIGEQIKSEISSRTADTQSIRDLIRVQNETFNAHLKGSVDALTNQLQSESNARRDVSDDLRRLNEREVARNDEFDRRFLDLTKTTERLAGRGGAIFDLFKSGQLNLDTTKSIPDHGAAK